MDVSALLRTGVINRPVLIFLRDAAIAIHCGLSVIAHGRLFSGALELGMCLLHGARECFICCGRKAPVERVNTTSVI